MASGAILAERAAVHVIRLVAGDARCRQFCVFDVFLLVTTVTRGFCVGACQFVFSVGVMVETNLLPSVGRMAAFAIGSKTAFVLIVGLVTIHTGDSGVLENRRFMAFFAGNDHMESYQREVSQPMVENHVCSPGRFVMAIRAALAEGILVRILLFVA